MQQTSYIESIALTQSERKSLFRRGLMRGPGRVEALGTLTVSERATLLKRGLMKPADSLRNYLNDFGNN